MNKLTLKLSPFVLFLSLTQAQAGLVEQSQLMEGKMLSAPAVYEGNSDCHQKIPPGTKKLLFDMFYTITKNDRATAQKGHYTFSKMIGKLFKESSGNAAAYADMRGNGSSQAVKAFYANEGKASIAMVKSLRSNKKVARMYKTNFGLLQISVDQLYWRPEAREIFESVTARFNANTSEGLAMCGTSSTYSDDPAALLKEFDTFRTCKIGDTKKVRKVKGKKQTFPVVSAKELNCFDKWMSNCPALNIGIGLRLPLAYFETAGAAPLCGKELTTLLNYKGL